MCVLLYDIKYYKLYYCYFKKKLRHLRLKFKEFSDILALRES